MVSAYVLMSGLATLWTTRSCQRSVTPVSCKWQRICLKLSWRHAERKEHAADRCRNHHQSSKSMEQEAAKIMWQHSVEKFSFRYAEMLSDGNSAAYKAVCDIAPYGENVINKLECGGIAEAGKGVQWHCGSWQRKSGWDAEELAG